MINPSKYLITNPSGVRKFVTNLNKPGALLPVILLESTVTGGRTYQANKRDGFVEARERFTEEFLAAIFWLFGAKIFGALFDKIGQKFFKVPKNMPSVGRDNLRTPFNNFINKTAGVLNFSSEKAGNVKKRLANYSVGKTFASLLTACLFIGIVVPKLNQAITKYMFKHKGNTGSKNGNETDTQQSRLTLKDTRLLFSAKDISINAVENFKAKRHNDTASHANSNPSFKAGADTALRIVQNFEENDIWKLMGTDVGTVSGRTFNARNKDERVEILFRDLSSIYFYCFSMPAIVAFMNKKDSLKGLNTRLNPMSAMEVHNHLINKMAQQGMDSKVSADVFKEFALGKELDKDLLEKFFEPREKTVTKKYLFGLFKKETELEPRLMKLSEFEAKVDAYAPEADRARLKELGRKTASMLQPEKYFENEQNSVKVITETQVEDILRGGAVREPEFLSDVINNMLKTGSNKKPTTRFVRIIKRVFGSEYDAKPLTNPYKYFSSLDIDGKRQQILDYVQSIVDDAKNFGNNVTAERMVELNKRNMRKNGLFMLLAMGVSSLFLSTIIPKVQYFITYLRTGKNSFPGIENLND